MKAYGITDKGCVRSENQDRFLLKVLDEAEIAAMVLCDGMGGAAAGATASSTAANAFIRTRRSAWQRRIRPPWMSS